MILSKQRKALCELEQELLLVTSIEYLLEYGGAVFLDTILSIRNNIDKERHARVPFENSDVISLDLELGEDGGDSIVDMVAGNEKSPLQVVEERSNREVIEGILSALTLREQEVISRRFGLRGFQSQTLEEVAYYLISISRGKGMHNLLTREHVRQIEVKALRKLRTKLRILGLPRDAF